MAKTRKLEIRNPRVTCKLDDIHLVDGAKLKAADESRFYFEINFSFGMMFLGVTVSDFDWHLCIAAIIFFSVGISHLSQTAIKRKKLMNGKGP